MLWPKLSGAGMAPGSTWVKSPDGWMGLGGLFRWSTARVGSASAAQIATTLAEHGYTSISVWQDSWPSDWPAADQELGPRNRIELVQNTGADQWVPPSVDVYIRPHGQVSTVVGAPPTGAAELATAALMAAIASGVV